MLFFLGVFYSSILSIILINCVYFTMSNYIVLIQRLYQFRAGIASVIFAIYYLNIYQQGCYCIFISLSSLFTIFDLGLSLVLLQLAIHYLAPLISVISYSAFNFLVNKLYVYAEWLLNWVYGMELLNLYFVIFYEWIYESDFIQ